jgi:hypothetical protein
MPKVIRHTGWPSTINGITAGRQWQYPARRVDSPKPPLSWMDWCYSAPKRMASTYFIATGPDLVVHVHLGLYGVFTEAMLPVQPPRGQVRMRLRLHALDRPARADGRANYSLTTRPWAAVCARLGPDPAGVGTVCWAGVGLVFLVMLLVVIFVDQSLAQGGT